MRREVERSEEAFRNAERREAEKQAVRQAAEARDAMRRDAEARERARRMEEEVRKAEHAAAEARARQEAQRRAAEEQRRQQQSQQQTPRRGAAAAQADDPGTVSAVQKLVQVGAVACARHARARRPSRRARHVPVSWLIRYASARGVEQPDALTNAQLDAWTGAWLQHQSYCVPPLRASSAYSPYCVPPLRTRYPQRESTTHDRPVPFFTCDGPALAGERAACGRAHGAHRAHHGQLERRLHRLHAAPLLRQPGRLLQGTPHALRARRLVCPLPTARENLAQECRDRYKAFASRVHPDKIPQGMEELRPKAEEAFKALHNALDNSKKFGDGGAASTPAPSPGGSNWQRARTAYQSSAYHSPPSAGARQGTPGYGPGAPGYASGGSYPSGARSAYQSSPGWQPQSDAYRDL